MRQVSPTEIEDVEATKPASLASTDFSSQDGPSETVLVLHAPENAGRG
jgi:hypothetical protein